MLLLQTEGRLESSAADSSMISGVSCAGDVSELPDEGYYCSCACCYMITRYCVWLTNSFIVSNYFLIFM